MPTLVVNMQRSSVVALLFLLDIVAWIILLGGVGAWQYRCDNGEPSSRTIVIPTPVPSSPAEIGPPPDAAGRKLLARHLLATTITAKNETIQIVDQACGTAYVGLNWWALFFQLFVLGFLFVSYFNKGHGKYKIALMMNLAMVTTLMFTTTNQTFTTIKNASGETKAAAQATAAGFIISMIANMLIILVIGGEVHDTLSHEFVPFNGPQSGGPPGPAHVQMSTQGAPSAATK